jgi:hypothetical protein
MDLALQLSFGILSEEELSSLISNAAAVRTIFSTQEAPLLCFKALYKYQLIALNGRLCSCWEKKEHTVIGSLSLTAVGNALQRNNYTASCIFKEKGAGRRLLRVFFTKRLLSFHSDLRVAALLKQLSILP